MSNETIYEDLLELTIRLAKERRVEALLVHVLDAALRLSRAEGAAIFTLDRLARHLHRVCFNYRGITSANHSDARISIYDKSLAPNLRDPATFAVSTATLVGVADIDNAPGFDFGVIRESDKAINFRTRSVTILPLTVDGEETIGVLQLVNLPDKAGGFAGTLPKPVIHPMQGLASHAAAAIRNARLFEENQSLIRQLGRMNEELQQENTRLMSKAAASKSKKPKDLIGDSTPMEKVFDLIERAAGSSIPILLRGETGTGKEMMANYIHLSSSRSGNAFVAQNCAALPESLLESELFGYIKGAFTGALANKPGLVHEAHGGTLFLDEVGDMPPGLQAKVLRLLQEGEVRRVGSTKTELVDVRIVAATNVNLEEKMERGEFRKDLYYRLNVFPIVVPPLRERPSDIPRLIDHFLTEAIGGCGDRPELTGEALDTLLRWSYPGNVRELKNILERAALLANRGQPIGREHLPVEITGFRDEEARHALPTHIPDGDLKSIVGQYEALVIEAKLREANWNQSHAARNLKVSRRTMVEKLNRYSIRRPGAADAPTSKE
ncbi:sigma-54-dependent transcriptional regulator [Pseudorhizobium tarimense]|uniref:Sigma-54-dependent transcriptional regulator n=1 Tax=Pseudorhizobium tarimense TaxID=1079109 RepID=A0ABV2H471_9HYPH|nr:sigma 54-interacting transcriptional regulator [Pseudorhizobium tarimense]MCJ8518568.1 sigma 54-interacting transcriptional regulator [Pseudorhizobium tarimense]